MVTGLVWLGDVSERTLTTIADIYGIKADVECWCTRRCVTPNHLLATYWFGLQEECAKQRQCGNWHSENSPADYHVPRFRAFKEALATEVHKVAA